MHGLKFPLLIVLLISLTGCGIGEFLVKRSINGIEKDIVKQMNGFADFDATQKESINVFAADASDWIKQSRLPLLHNELQLIANDIETQGELQAQTWRSTINFLESPFALSEANGLVERVANFVYIMSDAHIIQASTKLEKDYQKNNQRRDKLSLKKRDKKIASAIKILFSELGAPRSKAQVRSAVDIFKQRRSWLEQEEDIENLAHRQFISVLANRSVSQAKFIKNFVSVWSTVESGSRRQEPEIWEHNVRIGLQGLNKLLGELTIEERQKVAMNTRRYALLFKSFANK